MNASFEVGFPSEEDAGKALKILGKSSEGPRASVKVMQRGSSLEVTIKADSFAALRARSTSLLRDLKIVMDSFKLVGKQIRK